MLLDEDYLNHQKSIVTTFSALRTFILICLAVLLTLVIIDVTRQNKSASLVAFSVTALTVALVCCIYQVFRLIDARSRKTLEVLK